MKSLKHLMLLIVLLAMLLPIQPVRADMAPPPAPGLGGLRPFGYQTTEVQMIYERVELTLHPLPPPDDLGAWIQEQIDVTAWFVLHNTGSKDEQMKAAFPLDNLNTPCGNTGPSGSWGLQVASIIPESFKVAKDGVALETQITEIDGIDCVKWATFDVHFPVNKDVLVKVDYSMKTDGIGRDLLFQYVLETGAGWKGPIKQAYVVVRFPYLVTNENVDARLTTPGYQSLYNEIFWSYRDLEPTPVDNINVAFFEPRTWTEILALQEQVARMPTDTNAWSKLLNEYVGSYNADKITASFENAIKLNSNNAELYARYAMFMNDKCCSFSIKDGETMPTGANENIKSRVMPLLNRALALDPKDKIALQLLDTVHYFFPKLTITPPPTIPRTPTPLVSDTPIATPSDTNTPFPSSTSQVVEVTVVQTRIVTATPANTAAPSPTLRPLSTPTLTAVPPTQSAPISNWLIWPLLVLVGFAGGVLVMRRKKV